MTFFPGGQNEPCLASLTIGTGAKLDITNNALVIDYTVQAR